LKFAGPSGESLRRSFRFFGRNCGKTFSSACDLAVQQSGQLTPFNLRHFCLVAQPFSGLNALICAPQKQAALAAGFCQALDIPALEYHRRVSSAFS
jgi:hypothetical protein